MQIQIDEAANLVQIHIVETHGPIHTAEFGDDTLDGPLVNADIEIGTGRIVGLEILGDTEVFVESLLTGHGYSVSVETGDGGED